MQGATPSPRYERLPGAWRARLRNAEDRRKTELAAELLRRFPFACAMSALLNLSLCVALWIRGSGGLALGLAVGLFLALVVERRRLVRATARP